MFFQIQVAASLPVCGKLAVGIRYRPGGVCLQTPSVGLFIGQWTQDVREKGYMYEIGVI